MWEGGDRLWLLAVPPRGHQGSRAALYWSGHPRGPWTEERCGPDSSMCPASVGRILRHGAMCCKYRTKFRREGGHHLYPRHFYPVSRILAACISPSWYPSQSLAQLSHSLPVGRSRGTVPYHTVCRPGHESSPTAASDSLLTADSTPPPHTVLDASALGLPGPAQSLKPAWYCGGWSSAHRICLPDSGCIIAAAGRSLQPRHSFWSASWLMLVLLALIALCLAGPSGHRLCQGSCWQSSSSRRHAKPGRRHSGDLRHADAAEAPPLPRRQQQQQQQPRAGPVRQWLRQPARCRAGLAAAAQKLAQKLTAWLERPCARQAVAALAVGSAAATWGLAPGQPLLSLGMSETCIGHISTRQASLRMLPAVAASRALGPMLQALPCSPAHKSRQRAEASQSSQTPTWRHDHLRPHPLVGITALCLAALPNPVSSRPVRMVLTGAPAVPLAVHGTLSRFTLVTLSYDGRAAGLPRWLAHYGSCPSVAEIVVVWNRGPAPPVKPCCSSAVVCEGSGCAEITTADAWHDKMHVGCVGATLGLKSCSSMGP